MSKTNTVTHGHLSTADVAASKAWHASKRRRARYLTCDTDLSIDFFEAFTSGPIIEDDFLALDDALSSLLFAPRDRESALAAGWIID